MRKTLLALNGPSLEDTGQQGIRQVCRLLIEETDQITGERPNLVRIIRLHPGRQIDENSTGDLRGNTRGDEATLSDYQSILVHRNRCTKSRQRIRCRQAL
jgi:hypothetical protein